MHRRPSWSTSDSIRCSTADRSRLESSPCGMARRMDCAFLARLVAEHQLDEYEAHELAQALSYSLVKAAYRL